jgi:hypothetical protein
MGEMAEHLDDSYDFSSELREFDLERRDREWRKMRDRFHDNSRAEIGATIECACCARKIVKKTYQQKFCPPVIKGKKKSYRCKDRYNNIVNPRGKFAHLADY